MTRSAMVAVMRFDSAGASLKKNLITNAKFTKKCVFSRIV